MTIRDNFDAEGVPNYEHGLPLKDCAAVCGPVCPRCFLDMLCSNTQADGPGLAARGYGLEPFTDPLYQKYYGEDVTDYNFFMVDKLNWFPDETTAQEQIGKELWWLGGQTPELGPFATSGCWFENPAVNSVVEAYIRTNFTLPEGTIQKTNANCPCLTAYPPGVQLTTNGGMRVVTGGKTYDNYPLDYGLNTCRSDDGLEPWCNVAENVKPDWCTSRWCYVDKDNCDSPTYISTYNPDADLYYTYAGCP